MMNSSKVLLEFTNIIPKLTLDAHKGQAGRIGIVGGCKAYTGAPYFAAFSALRVGCDIVHVICAEDASIAIKSYSPELIVLPVLDSQTFDFPSVLSNMHSLVIGPGLGRDENIFLSTRRIIDFAKNKNMPMVFDADSLYYINSNLDIVSNYPKAILTPNKVEFERLYKAVLNKPLESKATVQDVELVSRELGNVTVVCKGSEDIISDGINTVICDKKGSPRRCGGQGDILSGFMGVFNYWAHRNVTSTIKPTILAAFGACALSRQCSSLAFQQYNRGMISTDMLNKINHAFTSLFECE